MRHFDMTASSFFPDETFSFLTISSNASQAAFHAPILVYSAALLNMRSSTSVSPALAIASSVLAAISAKSLSLHSLCLRVN